MLADLIRHHLVETAGVDPAKFDQADLKVADLALDSLGLVEMLFEVEDRYGFQVEEPMRYLEMSFQDMIADIERSVLAKHGGQWPNLDQTGS